MYRYLNDSWFIQKKNSQIFIMLTTRRFFSSSVPQVKKGNIVLRISDSQYKVNLKDCHETITVFLHPAGEHSKLIIDCPVFVSNPASSDPSKHHSEIIAYGQTDPSTNKVMFTKLSCIHPERPISDLSKLCSNCPRRSQS